MKIRPIVWSLLMRDVVSPSLDRTATSSPGTYRKNCTTPIHLPIHARCSGVRPLLSLELISTPLKCASIITRLRFPSMAAMDNILHPSLSVASLPNAGQSCLIGRPLNVNGLKLARLRGVAVNVAIATC